MNTHKKRRELLGNQMASNSVMLLSSGVEKHKSHDEFYPFYPSMNFYYLTGITQNNVVLMMVKDDSLVHEYLFVEETTEYMRQWLGEKISKHEASTLSGINEIMIKWRKEFDDFLHYLMHYSKRDNYEIPEILYLDLYSYNVNLKPASERFFQKQIESYKNLTIKNINELLYPMRMIKDEAEINNLKQAIHITNQGLKRLMRELPHRENEMELEADFLHQIRLEDAKEISFQTIAASGENATVLHYEENDSPLFKKDLILFDLGAKFNYYSADISRTYPLSGTFDERQKAIYELVLKANKEAIKFAKAGITWAALNKVAMDILTEGAISLGIITKPEDITKYYYHSIGHYLGLDTHDVGGYGGVLKEGMVITIEPGLYVKEEGIGVRIEDNILITKDGNVNLSKDIIKEVKEIEEYIKENS